jgi:hypothetical protein
MDLPPIAHHTNQVLIICGTQKYILKLPTIGKDNNHGLMDYILISQALFITQLVMIALKMRMGKSR